MTHLINLIIPLLLLATFLSLMALVLNQRLKIISLKKIKFNFFATFVIASVLLSGFTFPTVGEAGAKESQSGKKAPKTRTRKTRTDSNNRNQTQNSNRIDNHFNEYDQ